MKRQTIVRLLALALTALMLLPALAACRSSDEEQLVVRYLNFKPEIADKYQQLADLYEQKTGVKVVVETAANNTYEQTTVGRGGGGAAFGAVSGRLFPQKHRHRDGAVSQL